jgi:hypothetical protein
VRILTTLVLTLALSMLWPVEAAAQGNWKPGDFGAVRFRLGLYHPQGNSKYWDDKFEGFTGDIANFKDTTWGMDFLWRLSPSSGLLFSGSFFEGRTNQAYRDWVDGDGNEISHTTRLGEWDMTAAFYFQPGGRRGKVAPYFALGGGFMWWELRENGWFIDFNDPNLPVVPADYRDRGTALVAFALAGLEIPLSWSWSFVAEGRYKWAEDELGGEFADAGTLDLSGYEVTAGFGWNF